MKPVSQDLPLRVVVLGIPHTGNNFVMQEILGDQQSQSVGKLLRGESGVTHSHIANNTPEWLPKLVRDTAIVVPLRHPQKVAKSFLSRRSWANAKAVYWDFGWKYLIETVDDYDPIYLPIDSERREDFLAALNIRLELDVKTDWPIVASNRAKTEVPESVTKEVDAMIEKYKTFFERFY